MCIRQITIRGNAWTLFDFAALGMVTILDDNSDVFNKTALLFRNRDGVVQQPEVIEMADEYQYSFNFYLCSQACAGTRPPRPEHLAYYRYNICPS